MIWYLTDPTEANTSHSGSKKDLILFRRVQEEKRERKKVLFTKHEGTHRNGNSVTWHCL